MSEFVTVLLFVKSPVAGAVKTRLAADVGDERALQIYQSMVESQLRRIPTEWVVEIHYSPPSDLPMMRAWLGNDRIYYPQVDGDLGARLEAGIGAALGRGSAAVFAIGGDCPELHASHFREAEAKISSAAFDVVFGPAEDGGYYLVGLQRPAPALFKDIPWSSAQTLQASITAARHASLRIHFLPKLRDVDTWEDYLMLEKQIQ